jgi:hypothetical protein
MLKQIVAIGLLVALMSSNFSRFFAYAGFELNQNYISQNLCVNKARPWMNCNGRCYFMKKIKQAEENEKKQAQKDQLNRLEIPIFGDAYRIAFVSPLISEVALGNYSIYSFSYSSRYIDTAFKPPKSIA